MKWFGALPRASAGSRIGYLCLAISAALPAARAMAQAELIPIWGIPGYELVWGEDVSSDGDVVVGTVSPRANQNSRAFRLELDGKRVTLGVLPGHIASRAEAISADGSTVIGGSRSEEGPWRVIRWREESGTQDLGPGYRAIDVSADGEVVLLEGDDGISYFWTEAAGRIELGMPEGAVSASAQAMTPDATRVVGDARYPGGVTRPFLWTSGSGMRDLGLPPGATYAPVLAISDDGASISGHVAIPDRYLYRWTEAGGFENLGVPPGGHVAQGSTLNHNGTLCAGWCVSSGQGQAMIWTQGLGVVPLSGHLADLGVDLSGWELDYAAAVSADGSTIVGTGTILTTTVQGWVVRLPRCAADFNRDAQATSQDFFDFLKSFFDSDPGVDFNGDGSINSSDFFDFLAAYFAGC
jgi:uncharacterized membrane protein